MDTNAGSNMVRHDNFGGREMPYYHSLEYTSVVTFKWSMCILLLYQCHSTLGHINPCLILLRNVTGFL